MHAARLGVRRPGPYHDRVRAKALPSHEIRMKTIWSFLKNSGIFVLGSVLSRAVGFLMLPILTAYIPPHDMGYYDLSLAYLTIVYEGVFMNIWVVVLRHMYDHEGEDEKARPIAGGLVVFSGSVVCYLSVALVVWLVGDFQYFWLIAAYGLMVSVSYFALYVCRGYRRNLEFAMGGVIAAVVVALVNIVLLVGFGWDFSAMYIAGIAGFLAQVLYLEARVGIIRRLKRSDFASISRRSVWSMVRYAIPIGINAVIFWFVYSFNRVVISQVLTLQENGLFAVAMRWGSILALVLHAMSFAWQDIAFGRSSSDGRFFGRASTVYFVALCGAVALVLPWVKLAFPFLVDDAYERALWVVPTTLIAGVFSGYFNFVVNIFYAIKDSRAIIWGTVVALVVNVAGVYPLIGWLGMQGANLSMALAFLFGTLTLHWILETKIGYRFNHALAGLGLLLPVGATVLYFQASTPINVFVGTVAGIVIFAALWHRFRDPLRAYFRQRTARSS